MINDFNLIKINNITTDTDEEKWADAEAEANYVTMVMAESVRQMLTFIIQDFDVEFVSTNKTKQPNGYLLKKRETDVSFGPFQTLQQAYEMALVDTLVQPSKEDMDENRVLN